MRICNIGDATDVIEIICETEELHRFRIYSELMDSNTKFCYIMSDDKDIVAIFESREVYKAEVHIYAKYGTKLSKVKKLLIEAGEWILNNTSTNSLINFVDYDSKHIQMLMGVIGAKRVGVIENVKGEDKHQIVYSSSLDNYRRM